MNSYQPSAPRAAIGVIAVALTALTIGLSVVLPAQRGADGAPATYATAQGATGATDVNIRYIDPIDVVVYRTRSVTSVQNTAAPRRKEQG